MFTAIFLMLLVVVPVFILAFYVVKKFHKDNTKATYDPEWDHNTKLQIFIWAFPLFIVCLLSILVWNSAHKLDPRNAIASTAKPMVIEVVALRWKWLFIYPEQGIASVNYVAFPEKTPVAFVLTAMDTPMNSFWIPQLDGQIYAMSGMITQTHLIADETGIYRGENTEINGTGYSDMTFTVQSFSQNDFANWVASVKQSPNVLDDNTFSTLAKPAQDVPIAYYSSTESGLYTKIVTKYMAHPTAGLGESSSNSMQNMSGM